MTDESMIIDGIHELDAAVTRLIATVEKGAAEALAEFADHEAERVRSAAANQSRQARAAARNISGRKISRGGQLSAGGTGQATSTASFGDLFFGAEFGGNQSPHAHFGTYTGSGRWFFPTVEHDEDDALIDAAETVMTRAAHEWSK